MAPPLLAAVPADTVLPATPPANDHIASAWTPARIALEGELWGDGYLAPGGAAELLRLTAPLGLSAASSLLMVGSGTSGAALTLAQQLGAWVTVRESDPELLAAGQRHVAADPSPLAGRVNVEGWNPAAPAFRAHFFHHTFGWDALRDATPETVLSGMASALKPSGHLVLVETVADHALDKADPGVSSWARLEGRSPVLPSPASISTALGRLGFDIRVVEDLSARHVKLALLGWKVLLRSMHAKPSAGRAAALVTEAELWTRRIRLIHQGNMRLVRWHAILRNRG